MDQAEYLTHDQQLKIVTLYYYQIFLNTWK